MAVFPLFWKGFVRRNGISIVFPAIAAALIYSDYSYTQECKKKKETSTSHEYVFE